MTFAKLHTWNLSTGLVIPSIAHIKSSHRHTWRPFNYTPELKTSSQLHTWHDFNCQSHIISTLCTRHNLNGKYNIISTVHMTLYPLHTWHLPIWPHYILIPTHITLFLLLTWHPIHTWNHLIWQNYIFSIAHKKSSPLQIWHPLKWNLTCPKQPCKI